MPTINKTPIRGPKQPIDYAKRNEKYGVYYNSKQWRNLRNWYIKRHPLCEECLKHDKVVAAEHVHHRVEFLKAPTEQRKWELLLDEDNLMALCRKCHETYHGKHKHQHK